MWNPSGSSLYKGNMRPATKTELVAHHDLMNDSGSIKFYGNINDESIFNVDLSHWADT